MLSKLWLFTFLVSLCFSYDKSFDAKNVYFMSEHFRTVAGVLHVNSPEIEELAGDILDIAEKTWSVEVERLGFLAPRNTDKKHIDIYIGNKGAYNSETQSIESIPSSYAGWATSYPSDNTPFFVLNPNIDLKTLEITIAHEFFHTIQYAYFDETKIDEPKWFKNIWWLEATAVLLEDEVYDDVNDYVTFLSSFYEQSYKNIEIYDGTHEYATAIYAKFFKEKYGFEIIKESLRRIESSGDKGYFEILDDILRSDYNSSMQEALKEFSLWVYNGSFEEGYLYPTIKKYPLSSSRKVEKGGILVLENLSNYVVASNTFYNQNFADSTQGMIAANQDVLVSNFSSHLIDYDLLSSHVLLENLLSLDGKPLFFPSDGFDFISSENVYTKDKNGVHVKIDTNNTTINDFIFPNDVLIKSFDTKQEQLYEKFKVKILTRKKIAL